MLHTRAERHDGKKDKMDLTSIQYSQSKHNDADHNSDEQTSTGLDTTQRQNNLAIQSTVSQPTEDAVNAVLATVSNGVQA